jgi:hypothetical protein
MRRGLLATFLILAASSLSGQVLHLPEVGSRLVNVPTHLGPGLYTFEVLFTHRFTETVSQAGGYDLLGFDSAADIGLGLGFGLGDDWTVDLYRSSFEKQLEASLKWTALWQGKGMPLGLGVRVGSDYRGANGIDDRWAGFAQLIASRRFGSRLDVFVVPSYVSDTPTLRNAANVLLGLAYRMGKGWSVAAEGIPANRDAKNAKVAWDAAIVKRIPGHEFLIYFGNSRATTTDLMVGSDIPGGFETGDVRIGFNLVRRFPE